LRQQLAVYYKFHPIVLKQKYIPSALKSAIYFAAWLSCRTSNLHGTQLRYSLCVRLVYRCYSFVSVTRWLYYPNQKKFSTSCIWTKIKRM